MNAYHRYLSKKLNLPDDNDIIVDVGWAKLKSWSPAGSGMGRSIYLDKVFEPEVTKLIKDTLKPGMTAVDVGADMGYFSILMSSLVGNNGKVLSFEPISWGFQRLQDNIKLNNITNIFCYNYALYDSSGVTFMPDPHEVSMLAGNTKNKSENSIEITLKIFDEAELNTDLSKINFVKIDCEGAEMNILLGMKDSLAKYKPSLMIEIHYDKINNFGYEGIDVIEFMTKLGYSHRIISETPLEKHYYFYS